MNAGTPRLGRPVSLFTIVFLLVIFAAFLLVARYFYHPAGTAPQNLAAENYPKEKEIEWRSDAEGRRKALAELRAVQTQQLTTYGWADQKAGKVRLPIERAMELTAQHYGAKK